MRGFFGFFSAITILSIATSLPLLALAGTFEVIPRGGPPRGQLTIRAQVVRKLSPNPTASSKIVVTRANGRVTISPF